MPASTQNSEVMALQEHAMCDALLKEALDFLNDRPAFSLRHDPHYTSYQLAAKIDAYFRGER